MQLTVGDGTRVVAVVLLLLLALVPLPVRGLSLTPTPRQSNFELVRSTPAVVLAVATSTEGVAGASDELTVLFHFRVRRALRGSLREGSQVSSLGIVSGVVEAPPQRDLSICRGGTLHRASSSFRYRLGGTYLLFLVQRSARWTVREGPLDCVAEEIADSRDAWLAAVHAYARVAGLEGERAQNAALSLLKRCAVAGAEPEECPAAMVDDITYHELPPHLRLWGEKRGRRPTFPVAQLHQIASSGDYGLRPELAVLLAQGAADEVLRWAVNQLANSGGKEREVALSVVGAHPSPEAVRRTEEVLAGRVDRDKIIVLEGMKRNPSAASRQLLRKLIVERSASSEVRAKLQDVAYFRADNELMTLLRTEDLK